MSNIKNWFCNIVNNELHAYNRVSNRDLSICFNFLQIPDTTTIVMTIAIMKNKVKKNSLNPTNFAKVMSCIESSIEEVLKNNDYAFVTDRALLILVGQSDSLFVHGDTLSINKDSAGYNVMKAYHHTKFYSMDLQGVCDSMVFPTADSTVYLYKEPVVWASGNQLTATEISMHMKDNQVDIFDMKNKAMIVNPVDSTMYKLLPDQRGVLFNQIKGRDMRGYVKNNELYLMMVNGSGESIFYPDDKGFIIGLNKAMSSTIKIELENKKIKDITFITKVEGTLNPLLLVKPEDRELKDFHWHIDKKPLQKEDIFH